MSKLNTSSNATSTLCQHDWSSWHTTRVDDTNRRKINIFLVHQRLVCIRLAQKSCKHNVWRSADYSDYDHVSWLPIIYRSSSIRPQPGQLVACFIDVNIRSRRTSLTQPAHLRQYDVNNSLLQYVALGFQTPMNVLPYRSHGDAKLWSYDGHRNSIIIIAHIVSRLKRGQEKHITTERKSCHYRLHILAVNENKTFVQQNWIKNCKCNGNALKRKRNLSLIARNRGYSPAKVRQELMCITVHYWAQCLKDQSLSQYDVSTYHK